MTESEWSEYCSLIAGEGNAPRQLTCERCGNKTDAGAWIGFAYVGAECLDQDDLEALE
jgi:hypothetical protein